MSLSKEKNFPVKNLVIFVLYSNKKFIKFKNKLQDHAMGCMEVHSNLVIYILSRC